VVPKRRQRVDASRLASGASAYEGMHRIGWPILTPLHGMVIAQDGVPVGAPRGRYLHRH
jgi:hypothetical protein